MSPFLQDNTKILNHLGGTILLSQPVLAPTSKSFASRWRLSLGPRARKSEQRSARVSRPTFSRIWWQTH